MHTFLVPVLEPGFNLGGALGFLASVYLRKKEGQLLAKSVKALPPMAAAVLVAIASEKIVEKLVDVDQHLLLML